MTDTTTDPTTYVPVIDRYLAALNETDAAKRLELTREAWTEDGGYFDPLQQAMGHDELAAVPIMAHEQAPGQRFVRTSGIDAHHGIVRFEWELADEDGAVTVAGVDVGIVADDGRLSRIAGFFGPIPERES
jgi:SnoaL-like domain